jgi:hypothetical protein
VLHQPPLDISNMLNLLPTGYVLGLEEYVPFDSSGDPVPPIFLQLPLLFFNQHSRCGFSPLSQLSLDILLPHVNLWVVRLDHPVANIIGNDHIPTLGRFGLIRAHQIFFLCSSSAMLMGNEFVSSFILPPSPRVNRPSFITDCTYYRK